MKKNVICFMLVCVCALCGHRVQAQFSLGNFAEQGRSAEFGRNAVATERF